MDEVRVEIDDRQLTLSNLEKVFYPTSGFTKAGVVDYYARIAGVMVPHLAGKAVTLVRAPDGVDGQRFMYVPGRGLFAAATSANGDIMLGEDRLRGLVAGARGPEGLAHALDRALGTAWDAELEPYRYAGDGAPVTWLTRVG